MYYVVVVRPEKDGLLTSIVPFEEKPQYNEYHDLVGNIYDCVEYVQTGIPNGQILVDDDGYNKGLPETCVIIEPDGTPYDYPLWGPLVFTKEVINEYGELDIEALTLDEAKRVYSFIIQRYYKKFEIILLNMKQGYSSRKR